MFLTINVNEKTGEGRSSKLSTTTQLQRSLDNRNWNLSIALIEPNYVIGYHNITPENAIVYYIDEASVLEKVGNVSEGLYNISMYEDTLKDIIGGEASNLNIKPLKHNGRLEVKIKRPFAILKRDNKFCSRFQYPVSKKVDHGEEC